MQKNTETKIVQSTQEDTKSATRNLLLDDLGLSNLTPIWETESIDEVTKQFIAEKLSKSEILISNIFTEVQIPDCQEP